VPRRDRVTVAVSHLAGGPPLVAVLGDALRDLPGDTTVRIQPWQTGRSDADAAFAEALRARVGPRSDVMAAPLDLAAASASFAGDRLVVALRFHAAVAAAAAGTPFLAVAHEPKLGGLARRLGQPALPAHAPSAIVRHAIDLALDHPPAPRAAVRGQQAAAEEAMALLRLLVHRGRLSDPSELAGLPLSSGGGSW
jgi:polysaccharide pyruvyl transferase WcaK-like protein